MTKTLDPKLRNIALLVAACFFMENLDGTIVTTAAPRIGRALGVPSTSVGLVIAAYLVTLAVLIPLSGWLAQRFGARPIFLLAITVFTLASAGCAASTTFAELVLCRVLQGAGGAMMVPVGRSVVLQRTAKTDVLRVISLLVWPALIAPVVAPLAGGVIITYASWPWLFLINVPLGVVAFAVAWRIVRSPRTATPAPLDRLGVVLTCGGLGAATWISYLLSLTHIPWTQAAGWVVAAALLLTGATHHLLRARHPLVNLRTLQVPTFRISLGSGSLFWAAIMAVPFLLTLLFQNEFHWSPVKSGALVLFVFVGNIAIKPATTPLLQRFGFRPIIVASTAGAAATMIAAAVLHASTPIVLIVLVALLNGVGRSVSLTCYSTICFSDTPPEQMRDANTLQATAQQLAVGLGVPLAAVALRAGAPLASILPGTPTAYAVAFVLLALIALVATVAALRLHPDAGSSVTRRPAESEPVSASP